MVYILYIYNEAICMIMYDLYLIIQYVIEIIGCDVMHCNASKIMMDTIIIYNVSAMAGNDLL